MQKTAYEMRSSDWSSDVCSSDVSVIPGGSRHFGVITTPEGSIFDGRHIQDIARMDPGDRYDATDVDDLHRALIHTGLVSSADIKPVQERSEERRVGKECVSTRRTRRSPYQ